MAILIFSKVQTKVCWPSLTSYPTFSAMLLPLTIWRVFQFRVWQLDVDYFTLSTALVTLGHRSLLFKLPKPFYLTILAYCAINWIVWHFFILIYIFSRTKSALSPSSPSSILNAVVIKPSSFMLLLRVYITHPASSTPFPLQSTSSPHISILLSPHFLHSLWLLLPILSLLISSPLCYYTFPP